MLLIFLQVIFSFLQLGVESRSLDLLPTKNCGWITNDRLAYHYVPQVFDIPWMAMLQYDDGNGTIVDGCGGSLINNRYVLTAASCIQKKSPLRLVNVRLGEHTKNQDVDCNIFYKSHGEESERECASPPEDFKIESAVVHSEYNPAQLNNDIGLIRLSKDVIIQDHIIPICLPVTKQLRDKQFERYKISGWGVTEHSAGSDVIMKAELLNVNNIECQQMLNKSNISNIQLTDKQMCASGQDQIGTCQGDTGGPLGRHTDYNNSYRYVQYGVASGGVDSCELKSVPGVYSRVVSYMEWILDNIEP